MVFPSDILRRDILKITRENLVKLLKEARKYKRKGQNFSKSRRLYVDEIGARNFYMFHVFVEASLFSYPRMLFGILESTPSPHPNLPVCDVIFGKISDGTWKNFEPRPLFEVRQLTSPPSLMTSYRLRDLESFELSSLYISFGT